VVPPRDSGGAIHTDITMDWAACFDCRLTFPTIRRRKCFVSYTNFFWNSVVLASFYFEMYKFHDEIPIRT
jgi:hypothetical protein